MEFTLRVVPIAHTTLYYANPVSGIGQSRATMAEWLPDGGVYQASIDADLLAEFAGRACYESWDRPNPATRSNVDYLKHILDVSHESVLEHSSVTFYVRDVSRSLLAELTRHRHLSFSVRSQRYVDESGNGIVVPLDIQNNDKAKALLQAMDARTRTAYRELMKALRQGPNALPRKRAQSAARAVLLGSQSTAIVVTGNLRAWRDVLKKRHHIAADEEIQAFALKVLYWLQDLAPHSVQDISDQPYGYGSGTSIQ